MTLTLLGTLIGIAVFDSLNPSLFLAQFYLLTTPQPEKRILSYILGVLVANFMFGVIVLAGLGAVASALFQQIPLDWVNVMQGLLGIGAVVFGVRYQATPQIGDVTRKPRTLGVAYAFAFGILVMVNELTTALPYLVALERMTTAGLPPLSNLMTLLLYNSVFSLPLFGFLALFMRYGSRFTVQIDRITRWVQVWTPRLLKYGTLGFGLLLLVSSARYFLSGVV
ncbi:MAG: GAP family protein [Armatimonadetes bacterium]|nr:GAP family protein [Anaerolineae bacterium]